MDQVWVVILTKDGEVLHRLPVYVEKEYPGRQDVTELSDKIAGLIHNSFVTTSWGEEELGE